MNVFSKIPVINKYAVKSCLKLDFNRCDNPYCNFKNPLQERAGRFTCAGRATNDVPSDVVNKSLAKPRCIGTYVVTADQAALVLEARAKANKAEIDTTVKRAASKRAAAVARLKDKELKELQKDLERERAAKIKEQRTQEWIRLAKEHAKQSQQEEERGPAVPEKKLKREEHERMQLAKKQSQQEEERRPAVVQPEKELKRETRRLPIVIKTGPPAGTSLTSVDSDEDLTNAPSMTSAPPAGTSLTSVDSDEDLTNAPSITSAPPLPTPRSILSQSGTTSPMRRRLRSEAAIPRPTCIMWAEPTPPQRGNSLPARRANYPPVSSKRNAKPRPAWVSHRNGVKITHYGELVPSTQLQEGP